MILLVANHALFEFQLLTLGDVILASLPGVPDVDHSGYLNARSMAPETASSTVLILQMASSWFVSTQCSPLINLDTLNDMTDVAGASARPCSWRKLLECWIRDVRATRYLHVQENQRVQLSAG